MRQSICRVVLTIVGLYLPFEVLFTRSHPCTTLFYRRSIRKAFIYSSVKMASSLQFPGKATANEIDLPVLDISQFSLADFDEQEISRLQNHVGVATIKEACKEWGFFRLVNHGIPPHLFHKVKTVSWNLVSASTEAKDRATTCNPVESYCRNPKSAPNYEAFTFPDLSNSDIVEESCRRIWPEEGNRNFCDTIRTYASCLSALVAKVTKIILASLDLDVNTFYRSDFEKCSFSLRIIHYRFEEKPLGEGALPAHTDVGCITILYQDDVGGLEVRSKEGEWLNVKPISHSFVVNIGDCLKGWTNGRYRSAEHRVVCNGWADRLSVAFFSYFPHDMEISAPAELVDEANPRRYRPFKFRQIRRMDRNNEEILATRLERVAGI